MRLIDADALVEAIKDYPYGFRGMIVCDIAKQPTIDAVDQSALHEALDEAEQRGYNKGLTDGLKDAAAIIAKREWKGAKNNVLHRPCGFEELL